MGIPTTGPPLKKPHLSKNDKRIDCNISHYVPFVVPCLPARSSSPTSSPTSSSSSLQESVWANTENRDMENPVSERSVGTTGELRGNPLQRYTEITGESKEVQRGRSHELPDWLHEFKENLVDESSSTEPWGNPERGSQDTSNSSHELPMEPRAKVEPGSGKHSVFSHFPKDPNCDICLKTKMTRVSCRRRADTVVPRAEHVGV